MKILSSDQLIEQQVALKLAPIVHLHSKEIHRPSSVDWYLQRCSLLIGEACINSTYLEMQGKFLVPDDMVTIVSQLTEESLVNASSSTNFGGDSNENISIFPNLGSNPTYEIGCPMSLYQQETLRGQPLVNNKCTSEAYVHITNPSSNLFYISYHFFYPYNGGLGPFGSWDSKPLGDPSYLAHIGDWETIMAIVKILNSSDISLMGIIYEAHGDSILFGDDTHTFFNKSLGQIEPIQVYSCWHSHSSRTEPGQYPTKTSFASDYADNGPEWATSNNLVFISNDGPAWVKYNGLWGANITVKNPLSIFHADSQVSGPPGPAFHSSWYKDLLMITFRDTNQYDTGRYPCVATCNNGSSVKVVEVHQSEGHGWLWYHVGTLQQDDTIKFGDSKQYDTGVNPSVAVCNTGTNIKVIEVHKSESEDTLWYHVGTLQQDDIIKFGSSKQYDTGKNPSVAVCNNGGRIKVIEVHQSEGHGWLWYRVGTLQPDDTIKFSDSKQYDTGINPSVAICNNGGNIKIIEVHQSEGHGWLWYHVGTLQQDDTIKFGDSKSYDTGVNPSVTVYSNGTNINMVEVHPSESEDTLWYRIGTLQSDETIVFSGSHQYDNGNNPSIAICNRAQEFKVVEVHQSESQNTLWYHGGTSLKQ